MRQMSHHGQLNRGRPRRRTDIDTSVFARDRAIPRRGAFASIAVGSPLTSARKHRRAWSSGRAEGRAEGRGPRIRVCVAWLPHRSRPPRVGLSPTSGRLSAPIVRSTTRILSATQALGSCHRFVPFSQAQGCSGCCARAALGASAWHVLWRSGSPGRRRLRRIPSSRRSPRSSLPRRGLIQIQGLTTSWCRCSSPSERTARWPT